MNRLKSNSHSLSSISKVISVLSGKGGVGKSILTFNLGERLAAEGFRVLIVDADIACGNLHIMANAQCQQSLADFASGTKSLAESIYKYNNLLDLLASPNSIIEGESGSFETGISELIDTLSQQASDYDLVLIDHPSGVSHQITEIASASDANLMVIAPELTSIADGYGLFKRLVAQKSDTNCRFLINRSESKAEAEHVAGKFLAMTERFIGQTPDFVGFLNESLLVKRSIGRQLPIAAIEPQSIEIQSLKDISRRLIQSLTTGISNQQIETNSELNLRPTSVDTRG